MLFKTLNGQTKDVSLTRYLIDWEDKNPVSKPQSQVKKFLRLYWEGKTVYEEAPVVGSRMRLDFYAPTEGPNRRGLVIEVSPSATHTEFNPFMHGSLAGYRATIKRDLAKQRWCELNGFTLVEVTDKELKAGLTAELFEETFGVVL